MPRLGAASATPPGGHTPTLAINGQRLLYGTTDGRQRVYVSASVSGTSGSGTLASPWALAYAASGAGGLIFPNAIVYLRGGSYNLPSGVTFSLSGIAGQPITFKPYPGETVIIDGSIRAFVDTPATAWEPVGSLVAGHNLYRSTVNYAPGSTGYYAGFVTIGGQQVTLAAHRDGTQSGTGVVFGKEFLASDYHEFRSPASGTSFVAASHAYYMGPGLAYNPTDQRIYCRLDPSTTAAQCGRSVVYPATTDPRTIPLNVFVSTGYGLHPTGSHLEFDDIQVVNFHTTIQHDTAGQVDITYNGLQLVPGFFGIKPGYVNGLTINGCTIDGKMPSESWWVAWSDVKGGAFTNGDHVRKCAIGSGEGAAAPVASNITITNSLIRQVFDGILADGATDCDVSFNTFDHVWDDGWQMYSNLQRVKVHDNAFYGAGPSHDGSGSANPVADPGTVYIYNNVIDTTRNHVFWGRKGRTDFVGEFESVPMSTHGTPAKYRMNNTTHVLDLVDEYMFPWKIYNNTIVCGAGATPSAIRYDETSGAVLPTGSCVSDFVSVAAFGDPDTRFQAQHEVYNNIFLIKDGRLLARDMVSNTAREVFDGNVYWNFTASARGYHSFVRFLTMSTGVKSGEAPSYIKTVTDLRGTQALADSQVYYAPGWEASGLTVDPSLNVVYRPTATSVQTGAVDITGKGWPGASVYRASRGSDLNVAALPG